MLPRNIIYEYERVLIGKRKNFPSYIFPSNKEQKERVAIEIMRYGVSKYLGWNKEQAATNLTYEMLEKIKVGDLVSYLIYPPEIDPKKDTFFIINKLYPGLREFNFRDLVIGVYKKVLSGELSRFPKGFFEGDNGELRAGLCLQYALSQNKIFSSLDEAYEFFTSPQSNAFLKKMKICGPLITLFSTPLEYFHYTLSDEARSELYYNYYVFQKALCDIKK